jgi:hypothetical protein
MVKNNDTNIQKRKPKSSGGTPRRGDRTKLRRTRFVEELDDTEDRPLDLEPDGKPRAKKAAVKKSVLSNPKPVIITVNESSDSDNSSILLRPVFARATEVLSESESESSDDESQPPEPATIPTFTTPSPFPDRTYEKYDPKDKEYNTDEAYTPGVRGGANDVALEPQIADLHPDELNALLAESAADLTALHDALIHAAAAQQQENVTMETDTQSEASSDLEAYLDPHGQDKHQERNHPGTSGRDDDEEGGPFIPVLSKRRPKNTTPIADPPFQPNTENPKTSLRFSIIVEIPDNNPKPMVSLCQSLRSTLTLAQKACIGPVGIALWDPSLPPIEGTAPILWKASELPDGSRGAKDKEIVQCFFDHWMNGIPNKKYVAYMKVRFVTSDPDKLQRPLAQLGSTIADDLLSLCKNPLKDTKIALSRNALPCQAVKTTVVGWLFGSVKSIHEDSFLPALRKELHIPPEVALGVRWKAIRNSRNYAPKTFQVVDGPAGNNHVPFDKDAPRPPSPQALTIEIDDQYYALYAPKFAALWKKKSKPKICGLHLRLVPCFSNPAMAVADDARKAEVAMMAQKQLHFVQNFTARLPMNSFIAFLDLPIPDVRTPGADWTLRRYLMKAAPKGFPSQRLFVTIDQHFKGHGFQAVTVKPFWEEAARALNNMIPECLQIFGSPAARWFTPAGLHAYKDVKWDPNSNLTISANRDIAACIEENFFMMGDGWKKPDTPSSRKDIQEALPAALNPTSRATTAAEYLAQRANDIQTDASIKSFGDQIFDRDHDGDTVHTVIIPNDNTTPISLLQPVVQLDLTGMELCTDHETRGDVESLGMSTAARTTETTRRDLKEAKQHNQALIDENELQADEMEALQRANDDLQTKLEFLMQQLAGVSTAPANRNSVALSDTRSSPNSSSSPKQAQGTNSAGAGHAGTGEGP